MPPARTGAAGTPTEPYVVSASVSGPHADVGPDLGPATHDALDVLRRVRADHKAHGWSPHDAWTFMRVTPAQRRDNQVWRSGRIPQDYWDASVEGVPDVYDVVDLEARPWGGLRLHAPALLQPGAPWREVRAWVSTPAAGLAATADALVEWLVRAVATPGATNGFVHADAIADPNGERVVIESRFPTAGLTDRVEGYYWCLALGAPQVERLGGADAVRSSAPCADFSPVDVGGRPGLLCRLTDDPAQLTDERVLAWRAYLEPLLRPGFPGRLDDLEPGNPLSRPVWLFEGPPAPAGAPSVLVHGGPAGQTSLRVTVPDGPARALECSLTTDGTGDRDVVGAVAGAVQAWCRTLAAGVLAGHEGAVDVSSGPVVGDGTVLRWRIEAASPLVPRAVAALVAVIHQLHEELNHAYAVHPPGPRLIELSLHAP